MDYHQNIGVILSAYCLGCITGLDESCTRVACILYLLESWSKVGGKVARTQNEMSMVLPHFFKDVEYSRVGDIDLKSVQTLKCELDENIEYATLSEAAYIVRRK